VSEVNEAVLQAIEAHVLTPQAVEQVIRLSEREDAQRAINGTDSPCLLTGLAQSAAGCSPGVVRVFLDENSTWVLNAAQRVTARRTKTFSPSTIISVGPADFRELFRARVDGFERFSAWEASHPAT
jgi:hypothetical protein